MEPTKKTIWGAAFTVSMSSFVAGASMMFMILALPVMTQEFDTSIFIIIWVVLAYSLVSNALTLPMGKMGDQYGRRRIFLIGFIIFTVASFLATTAPSAIVLVAYRIMQGIGASMTASLGQAIIAELAPPATRGRFIGIATSGWPIGALAGPIIGGAVLQFTGWRSLFLIMAITGMVITILAYLMLPRVGAPNQKREHDWIGAVLFTTSLSTALIGMTIGMGSSLGTSLMVPMFVISAVSISLFIVNEKRVKNPMLDLKLFKLDLFSPAITLSILETLGNNHIPLILTFYLQSLRGFDPIVTAGVLVFLPLFAILSPLGGWISDRIGTPIPIAVGLMLRILSYAILIMGGATISLVDLSIAMAVLGVSGTLLWVPITSMALGSVPRKDLGVGSAILYSLRHVGSLLSQGISVLIIAAIAIQSVSVKEIFTRSAEISPEAQSSVISGIIVVYQLTIVISIIGIVLAIFIIPKARKMRALSVDQKR